MIDEGKLEFTLEEWDRVLERLGECHTPEDELLYAKAHAIKIEEMKCRFRLAAANAIDESKEFWRKFDEGMEELDARHEALMSSQKHTVDEAIDLRAGIDEKIEDISTSIADHIKEARACARCGCRDKCTFAGDALCSRCGKYAAHEDEE